MHIRVAHISEQQSYFTNFAPMHFVVEVRFRTMVRHVLLACLLVQAAKQTAAADTTAKPAGQWEYTGKTGQSCTEVCAGLGKQCTPADEAVMTAFVKTVEDDTKVTSDLNKNLTCTKSTNSGSDAAMMPFVYPPSDCRAYHDTKSTSGTKCGTRPPKTEARLCHCSGEARYTPKNSVAVARNLPSKRPPMHSQ